MDIAKILAELRKERERIKEAILSLERSAGPRRGRRHGQSGSGGGGGSSGGPGSPLPAYASPRLEDGPTKEKKPRKKPGPQGLNDAAHLSGTGGRPSNSA